MKILLTRPRAQSAEFADQLRSAGFEPILFPVIEICPVEPNDALMQAMAHLDKYAWVVFTSVNAVEVVAKNEAMKQSSDVKGLLRFARNDIAPKIAAIGPKTAVALRAHGVEPDFVPQEYIAEAILPGLGEVNGKWILLPRAEIARPDLPEAIAKAGGIPHEIIVYRTLPATVDPDGLNALKSGVDVVTFTSASTVENFAALCKQHGLNPLKLPNNPLLACIGPITAQAAREAGFENVVVAKEYTTDGLLEEVHRYTRTHVNK
ncbi:MAG: uroporphyrinogen-III synthase [Anaerolineales bacterium]|nr:uroporphyrinogen-III synthase [Anaerolineales bacterium]NUQ86392.1 uroporphyrinogen-III synthase [Anaerolineales bacterium]